MSIAVASAAVGALNCSVEALFSALDFSADKQTKAALFSGIVNTRLLMLCNGEDASRFSAFHTVA